MKKKNAKLNLLVEVYSHSDWGLCKIVQLNEREAIVQGHGKAKIIRHPIPYGQINDNWIPTIKEQDLVEDGFGSAAPAICSICGYRSVYVCRPGDIRCHVCYDGNPKEWYKKY